MRVIFAMDAFSPSLQGSDNDRGNLLKAATQLSSSIIGNRHSEADCHAGAHDEEKLFEASITA